MSPRSKANLAFTLAAFVGIYAVIGWLGFALLGGLLIFVHRTAWAYLWECFAVAIVSTTIVVYIFRYRTIMRRIEHGRCPYCGYDMRATMDRCPECGMAPSQRGAVSQLRRKAFNALAMLSMLLFMSSTALWVRSYRACDCLDFATKVQTTRVCEIWGFTSNRGAVAWGWQDGNLVVGDGASFRSLPPFHWTGRTTIWNAMGFGYDAKSDVIAPPYFYSYWKLTIPYWSIAAVAALLPATWVLRRARKGNPTPPEGLPH